MSQDDVRFDAQGNYKFGEDIKEMNVQETKTFDTTTQRSIDIEPPNKVQNSRPSFNIKDLRARAMQQVESNKSQEDVKRIKLGENTISTDNINKKYGITESLEIKKEEIFIDDSIKKISYDDIDERDNVDDYNSSYGLIISSLNEVKDIAGISESEIVQFLKTVIANWARYPGSVFECSLYLGLRVYKINKVKKQINMVIGYNEHISSVLLEKESSMLQDNISKLNISDDGCVVLYDKVPALTISELESQSVLL